MLYGDNAKHMYHFIEFLIEIFHGTTLYDSSRHISSLFFQIHFMMPHLYIFKLVSNVLIFLNGDAHPPKSKNNDIPYIVRVAHYFDYIYR